VSVVHNNLNYFLVKESICSSAVSYFMSVVNGIITNDHFELIGTGFFANGTVHCMIGYWHVCLSDCPSVCLFLRLTVPLHMVSSGVC